MNIYMQLIVLLISITLNATFKQPQIGQDTLQAILKAAQEAKSWCNLQAELCNKRYNEITQIISHNATSNSSSLVQNQDRSVKQQLQDGIRAFKVPIHFDYQNRLGYYEDLLQTYLNSLNSSLNKLSSTNPKYWALAALKKAVSGALSIVRMNGSFGSENHAIYACHGIGKRVFYEKYINQVVDKAPAAIRPVIKKIAEPIQNLVSKLTDVTLGEQETWGGAIPFTPCILDNSRQKFTDLLTTYREFLDNNPNEVLTLFLDDWTYSPAEIAKDFAKSGLISYVHAQNGNMPWPTLKEMIDSNKRMVVFFDRFYDNLETDFPWLHYTDSYDGWPTHWEYKSASDLTKKDFTINEILKDSAFEKKQYSYPNNKLFIITHQVTQGLAGSKSAAKIVNAYDVLSYRINKITEMMGRKPNFISVDYYEYPNRDVLRFVRELNAQ